MRRLPMAVGPLLLCFVMASPVAAVQPDREPAGSPGPQVLDDCGFEVDVTFPIADQVVTSFFDQDGNLAKLIITGRNVVTYTNPANGVSITVNASGPAHFDFVRGTFSFEGLNTGPWDDSGLVLLAGRVDLETGEHVGHTVLLCPLLAGG
jgi:hypothetical protein